MLNHNYIGTEHILLGLIHEGEGVAAKALESLGISLEAVRQQVEEIIGQGQQAPSGHIPFTPRAKKVLELSLREALQLGHNYIGTEHISVQISTAYVSRSSSCCRVTKVARSRPMLVDPPKALRQLHSYSTSSVAISPSLRAKASSIRSSDARKRSSA